MKKIIAPGFLMSALAGCGSSTAQPTEERDETLLARGELARALLERGIAGGDTEFINQHVAPGYIQHNPVVADGREGLLGLVTFLQGQEAGFTIEVIRVLEDGDLVGTHSVMQLGDERSVVFDIFRFGDDGRFVEHWDGVQPWVETTASGNSMVDGPTAVEDVDQTEANRQLVIEFVRAVFVNGQIEQIPTYVVEDYRQHNPQIGNGRDALVGFFAGLAQQNISVRYTTVHRVVAEGNFVLTLSEGQIAGQPQAFYDLWRLEKGKIVEHWDVVQPVPTDMAHDNGMF